MASYDQTVVVGYLGADPKTRSVNGNKVCNFSVAVNRYKGKDQQDTIWFRCDAWGKTAEAVSQYCQKGSMVLVIGNVSVSQWTTRDDEARADLNLRAHQVRFMDSRSGANTRQSESATTDYARHMMKDGPLDDTPDFDDVPF